MGKITKFEVFLIFFIEFQIFAAFNKNICIKKRLGTINTEVIVSKLQKVKKNNIQK